MATTDPSPGGKHPDTSAPPLSSTVFRIRIERPRPHTALLLLEGDFEQSCVPHVRELLASRLRTFVQAILVDLSQISFVCVGALELLCEMTQHARRRGITLTVYTGTNPTVRRALQAADSECLLGLTETAPSNILAPRQAPKQ